LGANLARASPAMLKKNCAKLAAMRLVRNQNFAHGKSSANLAKAASSKNLKLQNTNILRC
jgi:hypothetical protein